ncbi:MULTISPECIES: conjugal transfer protein TraH [Vibrio]|uniref:conjugal transfer protein TraH n=1 Tax=Vibrio TaxID=662 RepID=UPI0001B93F93|nr:MULTISPECIES: conjugal transfer protein TraH [Vibrio]EEX34483.1 IncF plasmid conjugative transfer pilus assembly protein TraH [Vibrio coralliilyticus ATCC BAA-450]MDE3898520.1 conjugal transfer protein TraH [Vibrio sp. CC007]
MLRANGRALALLLTLAASSADAAGLQDALEAFYDGLDYQENVSTAHAYQGQAAHYYTGGSVYVRAPSRSLSLGAVTLPSIKAGCGGIDAFMGGFSHINSEELVHFGKAVVANALPFAVDLALQTWAPQIKQIRDHLQSVADRWLNQSISSCQAAEAGISGLAAFAVPQSQKHVCATMGVRNNAFSDWVAAQQGCGVGGQARTQLKQARQSEDLSALTKFHHNLVWSALMAVPQLASDPSLAEFLMSTTGTVIYDTTQHRHQYPSLVTESNRLVETLLTGGRVELYHCQDRSAKGCLAPQRAWRTVSPAQSLQQRVQRTLISLDLALREDTPLTTHQRALLEATRSPILAVFNSVHRAGSTPNFAAHARVIAVDLLETFMQAMLSNVRQAVVRQPLDRDELTEIEQSIIRVQAFSARFTQQAREQLQWQNAFIAHYQYQDAHQRQRLRRLLSTPSRVGGSQ